MILNIYSEKYGNKVGIERGKRIIYAVLKLAVYGVIISSLLLWRDLVSNLKYWGFQTNPYGPCLINKVVYGNYCIVCWHMDDLKMSHVNSTVVGDLLQQLEENYGKVAPLTTNQGKVHDHLGVVLDFNTNGKVKVMIPKHIHSIL